MAIYISGGGSGAGTSLIDTGSYSNITLFTTPNEANTLFIVSVTWGPHHASAVGGVFCCTPGAYANISNATPAANPVVGGGPNMIKVGPNVAVRLSFGNATHSGNQINVAWSY